MGDYTDLAKYAAPVLIYIMRVIVGILRNTKILSIMEKQHMPRTSEIAEKTAVCGKFEKNLRFF